MSGTRSLPFGADVSRETMDRLSEYAALLEKWTKSINLIAPNTVPDIWERHIEDSMQVFKLAPTGWKSWVDLGSGGGLPGIVIAILDPQRRPVTLVESDKRKCLFLKTVRRELDLNATVLNARIEAADITGVDVVSARALAPLTNLLGFAHKMLAEDGVALFPKGERYKQELEQAKEAWHFDAQEHTSNTNADSRVLKITRIQPRER